MGGLARRASYVNAFQAKFREVPHLYLDAGDLFSDLGFNPNLAAREGQLQREAVVRNEWVLRGYQQIQPETVANLTVRDLPFAGQHVFDRGAYQRRVAETPFAGSLISANVTPVGGRVAPPPFVIKELRGARLKSPRGDGVWRVGVVGVTRQAEATKAGFLIEDPFAAVRRVLPQVRAQADVVVVLAALNESDVYRVAKENPGVDIVIGNPGGSVGMATRTEGKAVVVMANYETKNLGELRLYQNQAGRLGEVKTRFIPLDRTVSDDPAAAEIVASARREYGQGH